MQVSDVDYNILSSAASFQQPHVQKIEAPTTESNKIEIQETDSYTHDSSESLATVGIYNSEGKIASTGDTEAQSQNKNSTDSDEDTSSHFVSRVSDLKSSNVKASGGASPAAASSSDDDDDDSEDSTTTKIVVINGQAYSETTTIKDGVKTVTRISLETGETTTTQTQA